MSTQTQPRAYVKPRKNGEAYSKRSGRRNLAKSVVGDVHIAAPNSAVTLDDVDIVPTPRFALQTKSADFV